MLRRPGPFTGRALLAAGAAAAVILGSILPAAAALPTRFDIEPGSPVLISEVANGGPGASTQANRDSSKNFIEIANYGDRPVDISGWKVYRCGQTGGGYGPQAIVADGTVLQPGEQYTTAREGSGYAADSFYDTSLHSFGFGAFIEDADGQWRDAIGFYHEDIHTDCAVEGRWLQRGLQHRLEESHQRVSNTGDIEQDWVVAPRTVGEPNVTEHDVARIDNGLRFSEFNNSGAESTADQYVEITNYGDEPVDVTDYQLFRCGENSTQYLQVGALPEHVIEPGESYLAARAGGAYAEVADVTYSTSMHWRDFGVMLLTGDDEIVDRAGVYNNRNSACTDGRPSEEKLNHFDATTYQRVSDTGDNLTDFVVTTNRTPGVEDPAADHPPAPTFEGVQDLRLSEIAPGGPAGGNDEFFELANYGDHPVDLSGWSAYRCYGTGQPGIGGNAQIADLGVTLEPGETYLGVAAGAPAALRDIADGIYETGLNQTDGYGMYITDAEGRLVDAFAAYDVNVDQYTPCRLGQEARNWTKSDLGESYTRAQFLGDNELDFVVTAERTPGELRDAEYVDPTEPLPGELDAVSVETNHVPGTPSVTEGDDGTVTVTTTDEGGTSLELSARAADLLALDDVVVHAGVSPDPVPATLAVDGEQLADEATAEVAGTAGGYPFQRFEVPTDGPVELVWSGTATPRNELQLLLWDGAAWQQADVAVPSTDGDITLIGEVPSTAISDGVAQLMVIDGPRTSGGLLDEIGVQDNAFADPASYDVAVNHMTDTQFLSEAFRDVFRQMATWVIANADARSIGYNTLTGDIIENWMNGNHAPERADREFQAASDIMSLLNDAGLPNGVLPGNHDNFWGRSNDKYNEYFPVSMYEGHPWYGEPWAPGDNSAHTDYFSAAGTDFLVVSLPYRPSYEQMEWAAQQAQEHPDHSVILAAHSYLHTSGERDDVDRRYTATGQDVWERVVAPNDNVFLVLGGHYHGVSTQYADPVTGEQTDATEVGGDVVAVSNVGVSGRTVVEMLADYQGYRSTLEEDPTLTREDMLDRDTGFQRLLQLDLDAGLMAVNAYSPTLDTFEAWRYDEPAFRGENARYDAGDEEFVVEVDLVRSTTLTPTTVAVTEPSSEVASASRAPGEAVELTLEAGDSDQLWYVRVTDDDGNVVTSVPAVLPAVAEEPTEPADPTEEPTEPADPTEEPTDPADPTDPAEPTDQDDPAAQPTGAAGGSGDGTGSGATPDGGRGLPVTGAAVAGVVLLAGLAIAVGLTLRRRALAEI